MRRRQIVLFPRRGAASFNDCAGASRRPASLLQSGAVVPERVVSAGVPVGGLWLSLGSLAAYERTYPMACRVSA